MDGKVNSICVDVSSHPSAYHSAYWQESEHPNLEVRNWVSNQHIGEKQKDKDINVS
jgi:hypothetical protein